MNRSAKRIYLFFIIAFIFNMAANFAHPVTPTFIVDRQLDSSLFGVALAAMMAMNFLFSPLWGRLCSYISTRSILFISLLGYAVGQVIFCTSYNTLQVIAGRAFAGIFVGGIFTALSNYVINTTDSSFHGQHLTTLAMMNTVGGACGYFVGGMLGLLSVEITFIIQIIVLAFTGVCFFMICLDDTPFKLRPDKPLRLRDANPFGAFLVSREFMTPMLALVFAITAISAIGHNSYEQCFNYFIKDQFGMSSAYNGSIKAGIAILSLFLNSTLCMYLQKKTDIHKTFLPIFWVCTGILLVALIAQGKILFVGAYIVYSGFHAVRLPLLQAMSASLSTKETSNAIMGFYQSMNSLGGIFGALFAGLIYAQGARLPFALAFGAFLLASALGVYYRRNKQ